MQARTPTPTQAERDAEERRAAAEYQAREADRQAADRKIKSGVKTETFRLTPPRAPISPRITKPKG